MKRLALVLIAVALGGGALAPADARAAEPEVALIIQGNRFMPEEIKVKAGAPFVLVITNKDATAEEFESKELRIEKIVPAGKTVKVRVRALTPGTYPLFGEYHEKTARGRILAE